jgi:hypothetical protein
MKQQQGKEYQLDLFDTTIQDSLHLFPSYETVIGAGEQERALADNLMQIVLLPENHKRSYKQVIKKNKGATGIDDMVVGDFAS